jgi:uncharacterized protein (TIGR00730 family)
MRRICVFSGSSTGARPEYAAAARTLGTALVRRGLSLVYGGAKVGLMGVVADTVLAGGGEVIGIIPKRLMTKELAHPGLAELRVVASMHDRKREMADLADAFVALPGGIGTLEELTEVLSWAQLGLHDKPCGVLEVADYFGRLIAFLDHAVDERFLQPAHRAMLVVANDAEDLLARLAGYRAPVVEKWLDRETT